MNSNAVTMLYAIKGGPQQYTPRDWPTIMALAQMGYITYNVGFDPSTRHRQKGTESIEVQITSKGLAWLG